MWNKSRLDAWDEIKAAEDDASKFSEDMQAGTSFAFPDAKLQDSIAALSDLVGQTLANNPEQFYSPAAGMPREYGFQDGMLSFKSAVQTETEANNIAYARIREARTRNAAAIILPHWNSAPGVYGVLSDNLIRFGVSVIEPHLPYHGLRSAPGKPIADDFLSANLGKTIRSVRQAVIDTRGIVEWLASRGYKNIAVIGMSLGSCIAGLVGAHEPRVRASVLMLTAGDFAEVVWTGRATRHVRKPLEQGINLDDLRKIWSIISTGTFAKQLARDDHRLLIISGNRDQVVKPYLTEKFIEQLRGQHVQYERHVLGCGHYSLARFPFNVFTFVDLIVFLNKIGMLRYSAFFNHFYK